MKILRLLNKKNLSIIIIYLLIFFSVKAEDKPIDIWKIDKKIDTSTEVNTSVEKKEEISETIFSFNCNYRSYFFIK